MERDVHQSAFTRWLDVGNRKDRFGPEFSVLDYADATRSFSNQHAAIRQPRKCPWDLQASSDGLNAKSGIRTVGGSRVARCLLRAAAHRSKNRQKDHEQERFTEHFRR